MQKSVESSFRLNNLIGKTAGTRFNLSILSLVSLSACQFGKAKSVDLGGIAEKGPLKNALVFLDYNRDGELSKGEPFTHTNDDGTFELAGKAGYSFTVKTDENTIDSSSGEVLADVILKAPSGSSVISPTTTMIEATGLSAQEVGKVLGLPEGFDPTTDSAFSSDIDPEMALAVEKVAHQVMTTVTAISSAVEGTGAGKDDAFLLAVASVADVIQEKGAAIADNPDAQVTLDFSNTDEITNITQKAAVRVEETGVGNVETFNQVAATLGEAVANVNNAITQAEDLKSDDSKALFALSSELKTQVKAAAEDPEANLASITFSQADAVSAAAVEKVTSLSGDLTDYSGTVIKGPLKDALVFLDYNSDGLPSPGEPTAKTGADGSFSISQARPNMSFTVLTDENTLDTSSNQILDNVILKSPQGSEVVSPLTTLMVETELDAAKIVSVLGLPTGLDPTKFNPFSEEVDATEALSVEIISHQIVTTLTAISTVFEAADVDPKAAFEIALEAFGEVLSNKVDSGETLSSEDFSNSEIIETIVTSAGDKIEELELADLDLIAVDQAQLTAAIVNVNLAIAGSTDLTSEESIANFSLSTQLNQQIQGVISGAEGSDGGIEFADESVLHPPESFPVFQAGGSIHIDYSALDTTSNIDFVRFYFRDQTGQTITLSDHEQDGIVSTRLDENQMNGKYTLQSIELQDDSQNGNRVTYNADGRVSYYDTETQTWLEDTHTHKFNYFAFEVEGGREAQTDFTPPELISLAVTATEVEAGGRVKVEYEASDAGSGIREISFQFRDESGSSFYVYDHENDGFATTLLNSDQVNGTYSLYSVNIRDDAYQENRIYYNDVGDTEVYNPQTGSYTYTEGGHDFDFSSHTLKVSGGRDPQTDFTAPELTSITIPDGDFTNNTGTRLHIAYEGSDLDSGLDRVEFRFTNESGNSYTFYDYDDDGFVSVDLHNLQADTYTLQSVNIRDDAYQANRINYNDVGDTEVYNPQTGSYIYTEGGHDFDLSSYSFEVKEGESITDSTPPELLTFSIRNTDLAPGDRLHVDYTASDPETPVTYMRIEFKDNWVSATDNDGDGVASTKINEWTQKGTFSIQRLEIKSGGGTMYYYEDGSSRYYDYSSQSWVNGPQHDFKFSETTITIPEEEREPQTDWTHPELVSVELTTDEFRHNDTVTVNYEAFDADSELGNVQFTFRNENGQTVYLYDNDDDGVATGRIESWQREGTYELASVNLYDTAFESNNITYSASGRAHKSHPDYDRHISSEHDLDFSDISFDVVKEEVIQTDFTPPSLEGFSLRSGQLSKGDRVYIDYTADDFDSNFNEAIFRFKNEAGNSIEVSDYDDDGIASRKLEDWMSDGIYKLEYIRLTDTAQPSNISIYFYADGTTETKDNNGNTLDEGTHEHDFDTFTFSYDKPDGEEPEPPTDNDIPELVSFDFSERNFSAEEPVDPGEEENPGQGSDDGSGDGGGTTPTPQNFTAKAGDRIFVKYDATDVENDINSVNIYFRNQDTGHSIHGSDHDGDGFITINLSQDLENGKYTFDYMYLYDDVNPSNQIRYSYDGHVQFTDQNGHWNSDNHDLKLDDLSITIVEGRDPQTDFTAPEINSISFSSTEELLDFDATAGERLNIYYDAADADGDIQSAHIYFRNEDGIQISGSDHEADGVFTINLNQDLPNGDYSFYRMHVYDNQRSSNSGTLNADGLYSYYDSKYFETVNEIYDPDFAGLTLTISGGSAEQTDFTPPDLKSVTLVDNEVQKGEKINISYDASDLGEGLNYVYVQFKDANNNYISGSDHDRDGVITLNISSSQSAGEYKFHSFQLHDRAYQQNSITYGPDSQTTKDVNVNVGQSGMAPVTLAITVDQDANGNNKFFVDGVLLETLELNGGQTYIFDQSDSSNDGHPLLFSETEHGTHGGGVAYATGVTATGTAGQAGASTTFVVPTDAPSLYLYCSAHTGMGHAVVANQFHLKDLSIKVVDSVDDPAKDTDATPPVLTSISIENDTAEAGERFNIKYVASDAVSGLKQAEFYFRNEHGQSMYLYDHDNDGFASTSISSSQRNGTYKLQEVRLYDEATEQNYVFYDKDGITTFFDKTYDTTLNGLHTINFDVLSFKVVGGQDERTDFTSPELISVNLPKQDVVAGKRAQIEFEAQDTDTGFNRIEFYYRHETSNNTFTLSDYNDDGVAQTNLGSNLANGTYNLERITIYDHAYNYSYYYENGTYNYQAGADLGQLQGLHDFDFSELSLNVSGGSPIQTDFTPPELLSFSLDSTEVAAGDRVYIEYSAFDLEGDIGRAEFNFYNGTNNFYVYDYDGDGIASYRLSTTQTEGDYWLAHIKIDDTAYSTNGMKYNSDGSTEKHSGWSSSRFGEHEFDLENFILKVTPEVPHPDPKTDFNPPVLEGLSLLARGDAIEIIAPPDSGGGEETEEPPVPIFTLEDHITAKAGEKVQLYYDASDVGEGVRYARIEFYNKDSNQTIYGTDSDRDGVITLNLSSDLFSGDFTLRQIAIEDDNPSRNQTEYFSNGSSQTRTRDLENNQWIYKSSSEPFGFNDLKITVTDGQAPQTDFTAPELSSISFSKTDDDVSSFTEAAGEKVQLYYDASDVGEGVRSIRIEFYNKDSNQTIYGTDNDRDGVITLNLSSDLFSGDYALRQLYIEDDNFNRNRTDYHNNGTETARTWEPEDNSWDYFKSISDIDVTDLKITVTAKETPPATQTDFLYPVVEGLTLDQATVEAGDMLYLYYDITDFAQKRDANGDLVFGEQSLIDANGDYAGAEYSAVAGRKNDLGYAYSDDASVYWLTDANGDIIFESTQRFEETSSYGVYDPSGGIPTLSAYTGTVYTSSDYHIYNARTNFNDASHSGDGGYQRDERGEYLYWLKHRTTGDFLLDGNGDRLVLDRLVDDTKPLYGLASNFEDNGYYNSTTVYNNVTNVNPADNSALTDANGDTIYWVLESDGSVKNGSDGNPLVVLPLYLPKLAFPILTDQEDTGLQYVNAQFTNDAGNYFSGYDYDQDGVIHFHISSSQPNGTYQLTNLGGHDGAYSHNDFNMVGTFGKDGGQLGFNNRDTGNNWSGAHDFNFSQYTVDVVASTDQGGNQAQTDDIAPVIHNLSFEPNVLPFETLGTDDDDVIVGSLLEDVLSGLSGNDLIDGGSGDDVLKPGAGDDTITGGNGADIFEFLGQFGKDTITDFELGVDKIRILDENGTALTQTEYGELSFTAIDGGGILISHDDLNGEITLDDITGSASLDYFEII